MFFKQIHITIKVSLTQNRLAVRGEKKRFTNKTSTFVSYTLCTPDRAITIKQVEKFSLCKIKKKLSLKVGNISTTL
jgi:hypothetical protein